MPNITKDNLVATDVSTTKKLPSERIKELATEYHEKHVKNCMDHGYFCFISPRSFWGIAILDYLDEQAEEKL